MRTLINGSLIVRAFDEKVYNKQINTIEVTSATTNLLFDNRVTLTIANDIPVVGAGSASYVLSDGRCTIDLTDIIRISKDAELDGGSVTISTNIGESVEVTWINYAEIRAVWHPVPLHFPASVRDILRPVAGFNGIIVPPSHIIRHFTAQRTFFPVAYRPTQFVRDYNEEYEAGQDYIIDAMFIGYNYVLRDEDNNELCRIETKPQICGRDYIVVKWQDRTTGLDKVFVWEAINIQYTTTDEANILRVTGDYDVRKKQVLSVTARQTELTQYDAWFYGDIMQSNSVEVSFDGYEWIKGYIDNTDNILTTSQRELQTIEVNINLTRYED